MDKIDKIFERTAIHGIIKLPTKTKGEFYKSMRLNPDDPYSTIRIKAHLISNEDYLAKDHPSTHAFYRISISTPLELREASMIIGMDYNEVFITAIYDSKNYDVPTSFESLPFPIFNETEDGEEQYSVSNGSICSFNYVMLNKAYLWANDFELQVNIYLNNPKKIAIMTKDNYF